MILLGFFIYLGRYKTYCGSIKKVPRGSKIYSTLKGEMGGELKEDNKGIAVKEWALSKNNKMGSSSPLNLKTREEGMMFLSLL